MIDKKKLTDFPKLISQWHPTKNFGLRPECITAGSRKIVWWKCSVANDHEWQAAIQSRTRGRGCPCCSGNKIVISNCLATTHPDVAAEWHSTKNGDLTPYQITSGSTQRVYWKCPIAGDHEWFTTPNSRTNPANLAGCPCCSGKKTVTSNCLLTVNPTLAREWHPTKNNLTPENVTVGCGKKVWWKCNNCGHSWSATIHLRTALLSGCPKCRVSKGEKSIADYLSDNKIPHKHQWSPRDGDLPAKYKFDFAVNRADKFWLIEYHGEQHYLPRTFGSTTRNAKEILKDNIRRDAVKRQWCENSQKKVLTIPYWDKHRIQIILDAFFKDKEPYISAPPQFVEQFHTAREEMINQIIREGA